MTKADHLRVSEAMLLAEQSQMAQERRGTGLKGKLTCNDSCRSQIKLIKLGMDSKMALLKLFQLGKGVNQWMG